MTSRILLIVAATLCFLSLISCHKREPPEKDAQEHTTYSTSRLFDFEIATPKDLDFDEQLAFLSEFSKSYGGFSLWYGKGRTKLDKEGKFPYAEVDYLALGDLLNLNRSLWKNEWDVDFPELGEYCIPNPPPEYPPPRMEMGMKSTLPQTCNVIPLGGDRVLVRSAGYTLPIPAPGGGDSLELKRKGFGYAIRGVVCEGAGNDSFYMVFWGEHFDDAHPVPKIHYIFLGECPIEKQPDGKERLDVKPTGSIFHFYPDQHPYSYHNIREGRLTGPRILWDATGKIVEYENRESYDIDPNDVWIPFWVTRGKEIWYPPAYRIEP